MKNRSWTFWQGTKRIGHRVLWIVVGWFWFDKGNGKIISGLHCEIFSFEFWVFLWSLFFQFCHGLLNFLVLWESSFFYDFWVEWAAIYGNSLPRWRTVVLIDTGGWPVCMTNFQSGRNLQHLIPTNVQSWVNITGQTILLGVRFKCRPWRIADYSWFK